VTVGDARLRRHPLGFLQAAEPPSAEELKAFYAGQYFQTEKGNYRRAYSADELAFFELKIAQKADLIAGLRGPGPGSLLDVGCGEGFVLDWFAKAGWSVHGIDHSVAGLEAMNPHMLANVEIGDMFAQLDRQVALGRRYDLVWLSNVLEHVPDPVALLASLRRLVDAKGTLVVTVPNDGTAYQERLLSDGDIAERFWIAMPDHLAYFTYESLVSVALATGWTAHDVLADFPIDWFLLHPGSNYVRDRAKGPAAHQARVRLELMMGTRPHALVNQYYSALARVGLGRNLTAFLLPR
jgi:2-polyprenyl-3-methyl-5-hydroxy-6-metoxy-1,4-benzoquinol methylase